MVMMLFHCVIAYYCQVYGKSRLLARADVEIFGSYRVSNDYIEFTDGWELLWEQRPIHFGDLYIIKVIVKDEYIERTF